MTLSIDEATLRRARIRALEQGTSVNAVVRQFLESYAGIEGQRQAIDRFLAIADRSRAGSQGSHRTWERVDLYEDRVAWPRS